MTRQLTAASRRPSPTLGPRASFWVSAAIVCHTLWTSAAPAMAYPLLAAQWRLTPTVTMAIFAIYPILVVSTLVAFGDLSDHIGRRAAMLLGLAASALGVLLFALAPNVGWVFAGRAMMGVGVGLSASPSTAAMVEFSAPGRAKQANAVTTASQSVGYAGALLVGGALIQYAPLPTRLSFWLLLALIVALFVAAWFLPRRAGAAATPWRFRAPFVPRDLLGRFSVSALAVTAAYTLGALFLSLGAQVARDLVGSSNVLVNGAALSLFAVASGLCGVAARPLSSRVLIGVGGVASATAMVLLALSASERALPVFLVAVALAGVGYSLLFLGGLDRLERAIPAKRRGAILSALYLAAYLAMGAVALFLGVVATAQGLKTALDVGAAILGVLGLLAALLARSAADAP